MACTVARCAVRTFSRSFSTANTAIRSSGAGVPSSVLSFSDDPIADPGADQVQIKILAAPITGYDLASVKGLRSGSACGNEGVGVVTSVGSDVSGLLVNDKVVPVVAGLGTWSQNVVADAASVQKISDDIPVEQAATISGSSCLAYRLLADSASLSSGDVIIQNDAKSPVGKAVIQLAASRGIETINVIPNHPDSDKTTAHLQSIGGTYVVTESYLASTKGQRLTGDIGAPKLGLNCRGGKASGELAKAMGDGGTVVTYGTHRQAAVSVPTSTLLDKDLTLKGFSYNRYLESASAEEKADMIEAVSALVKDGTLTSFVLKTEFNRFFDALKEAEYEYTERVPMVTM